MFVDFLGGRFAFYGFQYDLNNDATVHEKKFDAQNSKTLTLPTSGVRKSFKTARRQRNSINSSW